MIALAAMFLLPAAISTAAAAEIRVVYDSDFAGYVPLVDGIERPDLAVRAGEGRVPLSARKARSRARRALRRGTDPFSGAELALIPPDHPEVFTGGDLSRRFLRRTAVTTHLLVVDEHEQPLAGARVFRYSDPAFYLVNEDAGGARLIGGRRLLPYPFGAAQALSAVQSLEPLWRWARYAPVRSSGPRLSTWNLPYDSGFQPVPRLPVEYVGQTGASGELTIVSGLFGLREEKLFPGSVVPDSLRIGLIVVADGYRPGLSERSYREGGVREERSVHLLTGPDHALLASPKLTVVQRLTDGLDLSTMGPREINEELERLLDFLEPALAPIASEHRSAVRHAVRARLLTRLERRAPPDLRVALAREALRAAPDSPVQSFLLARELWLAQQRQTDWREEGRGNPLPAQLEAESLLDSVLRRDAGFLPAYPLLDELLAARGAPAKERLASIRRLLEAHPFDRWGRARAGALLLAGGHPVEAFDHFRYTWITEPTLRGDGELALALARYYWNLGLPEKAGTFVWLHTGRPPEDPFHPLPVEAPRPARGAWAEGEGRAIP